jgi:two-component system, LytTR family, response regulator
MEKIITIIIDDEAPARDLLRHMLKDRSEITIVAECSDGFSGLKEIKEKKPDLIFLDIQMPKLTGFELIEVLDERPQVIFTTAYDQFAIKAFELNAIDYLLKPFSKSRLDEALDKAVPRIQKKESAPNPIDSLLTNKPDEGGPLTRIVIRKGSGIKIIPLSNISYIGAEDDYVMIYYDEGKALKQQTMKYYEDNLPPSLFLRVHRSFIVNLEKITRLEPYSKDNYVAILNTGEKIPVSRTGYKTLREKLNF